MQYKLDLLVNGLIHYSIDCQDEFEVQGISKKSAYLHIFDYQHIKIYLSFFANL